MFYTLSQTLIDNLKNKIYVEHIIWLTWDIHVYFVILFLQEPRLQTSRKDLYVNSSKKKKKVVWKLSFLCTKYWSVITKS